MNLAFLKNRLMEGCITVVRRRKEVKEKQTPQNVALSQKTTSSTSNFPSPSSNKQSTRSKEQNLTVSLVMLNLLSQPETATDILQRHRQTNQHLHSSLLK